MTRVETKPKPDSFGLWYGLAVLALGALLTWLVGLAQSEGIEPNMPGWAALAILFLGDYGIMWLFGSVAAVLWLGYLVQWLDVVPKPVRKWMDIVLNFVFATGLTVGLVVGGLVTATTCFEEGRWFAGSLGVLAAIAGSAFSIAMLGGRKLAANIIFAGVVAILFVGIPAALGLWAWESHEAGGHRGQVFGGLGFVIWVGLELFLLVGWVQTRRKRSTQT